MTEAVVQIKNLTKRIRKKTIVDHLTFNIVKGEVFGLLGPNGAGKTTTIRMMVGLMGMTEGEVLINNQSVEKNFEQAMQYVGAIVENPEMYKYLTGYQNLIHYSRMHDGISKERIDEVIKLVGLENRIHDKVKNYSLGMRQRLGVAQAILHKPLVLILDEPTNGLDPAGIRELRDYLRQLAEEEGIAVVISSHLLAEMELMCDRIAVIQNGKLVDVTRVKDLVRFEEEGLVHASFEVEQAEEIELILKEHIELISFKVHSDGFELHLKREQIPEVNALLVAKQIKVFGIKTKSKTLEDKFLEMTRGGSIV